MNPRRVTPAAVIAWTGLVVIVAAMAVLQHVGGKIGAPNHDDEFTVHTPDVSRQMPDGDESTTGSARQPSQGQIIKPPRPILIFLSRYAVGLNRLSSVASPHPTVPQQLIDQLEDAAISSVDQLYVAIVEAELIGKDVAVRRIEAVLESLPPAAVYTRTSGNGLLDLYRDKPEPARSASGDYLVKFHGWFGQLALSHGLSADHPDRIAAMMPAYRTIAALLLAVFIVAGAGVVGLVLLIVGLIMFANGKLRAGFATTATDASVWAGSRTALLEVFVLFLIVLVAMSTFAGVLNMITGIDLAWLLLWLVPLALFWARVRGMSMPEIRTAVGLHRGAGFVREACAGVAGLLAGLPLVAVGIGLTLLLTLVFKTETPSHPIADEMVTGSLWRVAQLYILGCVWAPLVEEAFFRGALYAHLRQRWRPIIAAGIVAFIFALVHPQGVAGVPALMSLAMVFALIREWRSSIIAPAVAHACNNAFVITLIVLIMR